MKVKRTPWTQIEVDDFIRWHEGRMAACGYGEDVLKELRKARTRWLGSVKRV